METFIVLAALLGVGFLCTFLFRLVKRQQAELAKSLAQAGYQPVPQTDTQLALALSEANGSGVGTKQSIKDIYKYSGLNYDLYRFTAVGNEHNDTRYAMDFRRDLFPPFTTVPNLKLPGFLGSMANKLFALALSRSNLKEIEVPGKPRFQERYRLYGTEAHVLLTAIPGDVWDRFAELPGHLCVSGQGRFLVLTSMVPVQERKLNDPAKDVRKMVESADALWHVFSEVRPLGSDSKLVTV